MTQQNKWERAETPKLKGHDIRVIVRHRDGYRCVECGMTAQEHKKKYRRTLDVHRVTPGSPYTVDGCIALCKKCHATKPKSPAGTPPTGEHKGVQINLRAWNPLLIPEIEKYAKKIGRSRNYAINLLIAEELTRAGYLASPGQVMPMMPQA